MKTILIFSFLLLTLTAESQSYIIVTNNPQAVIGVMNRNTVTANGQPIIPKFSSKDFSVMSNTVSLLRTNVSLKGYLITTTNGLLIVSTALASSSSYLVVSNAGTAATIGKYTNAGFTGGFLQFNNTNGLYVVIFNQTNSPTKYQGNPMLLTSSTHSTPNRLMYYSSGFPFDYVNQTQFPAAGTPFAMSGTYNGNDVVLAANPTPTLFLFTGVVVPTNLISVDTNLNLTANGAIVMTTANLLGGTPTFVTNAPTLISAAQFIGQAFDGAMLFSFTTTASPAQPVTTNLFTFTLSRTVSTNFVVPTYSMAWWPPLTNSTALTSARLSMQPNPNSPSNSFIITVGVTALSSSSEYTIALHVDRP